MIQDRVGDAVNEPNTILLPIDGYQNKPLVTLEKAVEPLFSLFDEQRLRVKVRTAKERCQHPEDGLSVDESAAIMLYTFEEHEREQNFYFVLNQTLRREDRILLKPWFLYLKLFFTALHQLPPITEQVLRGVRGDFSNEYARLNTTTWWGVSSCTINLNTLHSDAFFGYEGRRTLFLIRCRSGRSVKNHSYHAEENEIILLPGRYFKVAAQLNASDDVQIVQLEEIQPPHELCPPPGIAPWRERRSGMNIEGICTNSNCAAYEQEVIIPLSFQTFDVLVEMKNKAQCPMCSRFVSILRVSFRQCQWKWHGIEQNRLHSEPIIRQEDWTSTDNSSNFIVTRPGVQWLQLVFQVKHL